MCRAGRGAVAPRPLGPRVPRPVPRLLLVTHHTLARLLGRSGRPWGPARRQADLCVSGAPSVHPCSQGASVWLLSLLCGCSGFANNSPRLLPAFKRAHGGFMDSSPQGDTHALTAQPLRLTHMPESVFQRECGGRGMEPSCSGGGEQRVNAAAPGPHFRLSGECSLCCRPSPGPQAPKASLAPGAPGRPLTCSCSRPWVLGARLLPGVLSLPTPQLSPWDGSAHARPGAADHFGCHEGGGR